MNCSSHSLISYKNDVKPLPSHHYGRSHLKESLVYRDVEVLFLTPFTKEMTKLGRSSLQPIALFPGC